MHFSTVYLWEQGTHVPYRRTRDTLEAIFGMPIDALLAPENGDIRKDAAVATAALPAKVGVGPDGF